MENDIYDASQSILNHNHMVIDPSSKDVLPSLYIHSGLPGHDGHQQIMAGDPLLSTLHEAAMDNLYMTGNGDITNGDVLFLGSVPCVGNISCIGPIGNTDLREHFRGNSLSATSLANLLSVTTSLQENVISTNNTASASSLASEEMRTSIASNSCNTTNSSLTASVNCEFRQQDGAGYLTSRRDASLYGQLNYPWNYNGFPSHQQPSGKTFSTVHPSFHVKGSSDPGWIFNRPSMSYDHPHNGCALSNELSLSLGSCKPNMTDMSNVPDQCSEVGCSTDLQGGSRAFQNSFHDVGLGMAAGSRLTLPSSHELSLYRGSSGPVHLPRALLGSRYLHVAQRILAEVASYALEYSNDMDDSLGGIESEGKMSFSSCCSSVEGLPISGSDEFPQSSGETRPSLPGDGERHQGANATKSELVSLLQLLDDRYNQCIDQIQNVISAFHRATESGTSQMLARFALHTTSAFYKTLRERITGQILLIARQSCTEHTREKVKSFESSFIQKQWALQQLRKSDQQSWRPQRGLPENSVSVLRAWMFQNFLHPYPKDNEKQLLALKSGLTRSQVSNWFINARVRLWKPMIEEMYSELNKKNRGDEGPGSEGRSHGNIANRRF